MLAAGGCAEVLSGPGVRRSGGPLVRRLRGRSVSVLPQCRKVGPQGSPRLGAQEEDPRPGGRERLRWPERVCGAGRGREWGADTGERGPDA